MNVRVAIEWRSKVEPYTRSHWLPPGQISRGDSNFFATACGLNTYGMLQETKHSLDMIDCEECQAQVVAQVLIDEASLDKVLGR